MDSDLQKDVTSMSSAEASVVSVVLEDLEEAMAHHRGLRKQVSGLVERLKKRRRNTIHAILKFRVSKWRRWADVRSADRKAKEASVQVRV